MQLSDRRPVLPMGLSMSPLQRCLAAYGALSEHDRHRLQPVIRPTGAVEVIPALPREDACRDVLPLG